MRARILLLLSALALPGQVLAQNSLPYRNSANQIVDSIGIMCVQADRTVAPCATGTGGGAVTPTGTAGSPNAAVVTVQGIAGGTSQNVNNAQVNGATINAGLGTTAAGTQRVVLASDQSAIPISNTGFINTDTVTGNVASGAADTGSPVKVGCAYNTPATLTAGFRSDLICDSRQNLRVTPVLVGVTPADGGTSVGMAYSYVSSATASAIPQGVLNYVWNGTAIVLARGNANGTNVIGAQVGALNDGSGTLTTAATSQQVFAANPTRVYLFCQNPINATEPLYVNLGAASAVNNASYELAVGGSMTFASNMIPTGTVNVTAATANHRFICKQAG